MKKIFTILGLLIVPIPAWAFSISKYWTCDPTIFVCGSNAVSVLVGNVLTFISSTIITVGILAFMYGGVRMVVSQGGEGKEAGKKAMQFALMGIVLAYLTPRILQFILDLITAIA